MQKTKRFAVLFVAFGLTASVIAAAAASAAVQTPAPKEPLQIPRLTTAPKIDGVLDNPIWETQALKIDAFVQLSPKENGVPTERTVAYLGYDEKNLYVAFRAYDSQSSKVRCSVTNRDGCMEDDWVFIMLDTFNEKRRAFSFLINPIGIQMDMMRIEEGGSDNMDDSWDTVFLSDGKVDAEGYTVEMAIPFKSLRFPNDDIKTWNIVLGRNLPRTGEIIVHPQYSRDIPGLLSNGRTFTIQGAVERSRNVEVMPFMTSLKRQGDKLQFEPGANFKLGLSSNMTLDATVNPDFSQIEADEPKIDYNVRYALRYAEKRPFFLEGMEIFNSPEIETVYTRQITDPIWGGKMSGKSGRFTYGLLSAYDMHPTESLWEIPSGGAASDTRAFSNIFRTKADVGSGSYIGFTLTDKELGGGTWSRLGGLDGQLRFKDKVFFNFQALASKSSAGGDSTALAPGLYGELFYTSKHWN
ncbi:MAG: carbohydrate binding family 9 domain-containing protein, partial [Candidatus Aminicenantes bacterium]|nr:carbohydrate binding family 9 domain-containing protein [Candidatus Aminicenantes bacterium]